MARKPLKLIAIAGTLAVIAAVALASPLMMRKANESGAKSAMMGILDAEKKYNLQTHCYGTLEQLQSKRLVNGITSRGVAHEFRFMVAADCNQFFIVAVPAETQGFLRSGDHWYTVSVNGIILEKPVRKPVNLANQYSQSR